MKRSHLIAILAVAAATWAGARLTTSEPAAQNLAEVARRPPAYQSEQEWIVREVVRVIARSASDAAGAAARSTPTPDIVIRTRAASQVDLLTAATFDVTIDGEVQPPIVVAGHVWSPQTYLELAKHLVGRPASAAAPAETEDKWSTIAALTDLRVSVMLREEARVSGTLAASPRSAAAHENAALLVAALALRESAGMFGDVRALLSRTAGHLALARALSPDANPGPSGRLANIIVSALAGREDLALPDLDRWQATAATPAAAAWRNALRLRITGDWRQPTIVPSSSRLERLEYARALRGRVSASRMLNFLDTQVPDAEADWHRILLQDYWNWFTVEAGNQFVDPGFDRELEEIAQVWRAYHDGEPSFDQLLAALNDEDPQTSRAIDWPVWAAFLQRHLCAHLAASTTHLSNLGLEDELAAWPARAKARYGTLRLFPLVLRVTAHDASQYKAALAGARALQIARPDLVTPQLSRLMRVRPYFQHEPDTFPSDVRWFTPHVPTGTAFDLVNRTLAPGCARPVPIEQVARWSKMAPHDMWVQWSLVWLRAPGRPAFADVQRALGVLPEYDLRAARHMFNELEATNEQYLWAARWMCQMDVNECSRLGGQLLMSGQEAEAVAVFDRYAEWARDAVGVSNEIGWLVRRDWETGNRARAIELATAAGDTGSASGLELLGYVLERGGRGDEAEAVYSRIAERYENAGAALAGYYLRKARSTNDPRWVERAAQLVPKTFPGGIERADPAWLPAPPNEGMVFVTYGPRAARTGLRPTDIVAGVDGYRVRSNEQYQVLARGSYDSRMRFIVWRDGRYQEVTAAVPERRFGAILGTHPATRPPLVLARP